jgi:hypothetical protein
MKANTGFPIVYTDRIDLRPEQQMTSRTAASRSVLAQHFEEMLTTAERNGFGTVCEIRLFVGGTEYDLENHETEIRRKARTEVEAILTLADIPITNMWELLNGYDRRSQTPWFLVRTAHGLLELGWRKRVFYIDWSDTAVRTLITAEDVTKSLNMVHAWSVEKAIEYLKAWKIEADTKKGVDTKNDFA